MPNIHPPSTRSRLVTRRTYQRPTNDDGTTFETWTDTVDRVTSHQQWLWERAKGNHLTNAEHAELGDLRQDMLDRVATVSGRTLWLGGTDIAKTREASNFNCSFSESSTVHDIVDQFWLLLQGCGVGFKAVPGVLNGFTKPVEVTTIRSETVVGDPKGQETNSTQTYTTWGKTVWHLTVGDSAEAWAKAAGKLLAMKDSVDEVVIDFSQVRAAGIRLKGYGWISSGDATISVAFEKICEILNRRAGQLLTAMDIHDILTHLGTTLSSRRSAEIALMESDHPEIDDFIVAKKDFWLHGNEHRQQANNSVVFYHQPSDWELRYLFDRMVDAGGSEPGFINGSTALARAGWFKGVNPCGEILLGNKNKCNLCEVDWGKFDPNDPKDFELLCKTVHRIARANYRQTCVNLRDGILQSSWHELNEFLRLCGVGATGIVKFLDRVNPHQTGGPETLLRTLRGCAVEGANSMADELGLPRSKAITTVKPSGTLSKVMDTTEGVHRPLGRYIFNNVTFSKHDPTVQKLRDAGYRVFEKPFEAESVLVTFPVAYDDVEFDEVERDGETLYVNLESAVIQLERYKLLMEAYVDHNCSITVSYDPSEVPSIVEWLRDNWDVYVGVSFIFRNDPTKTAEDLGYAYLPQSVVTKSEYEEYVSQLTEVDLSDQSSLADLLDVECQSGVCPVR